SSGDFSLRKPPGTSVQQLVCGEVIEPQRCPNAAVLTASLQAQDQLEDVLTEQCRIDEFTCEQYINRQGVDDVESDVFMDALGFLAELGASFVAISGLQGTPGHEIQLVRFALAMRDRLDELRKALSSAGEVSQLSLAIGLDMGKATRLVLGRLSPHAEVSASVALQLRARPSLNHDHAVLACGEFFGLLDVEYGLHCGYRGKVTITGPAMRKARQTRDKRQSGAGFNQAEKMCAVVIRLLCDEAGIQTSRQALSGAAVSGKLRSAGWY
ncbi:unnamed protein product, partial [Symbiodinium necroappetens]